MPSLLEMSGNYQHMASLASSLQMTIAKQQATLTGLMGRIQANSDALLKVQSDTGVLNLKLEEGAQKEQEAPILRKPSLNPLETAEENQEEDQSKKVEKIPKNLGFKGIKKTKLAKTEKSKEGISKKTSREAENPKAKHLWVNYGRRIIEYAIKHTEGMVQANVKNLLGRLNSKKDFSNVFQIRKNDSAEDKEFKSTIGKLAINFVKNEAATTFESSKYKKQMISHRHLVAAYIERLIEG